MIITELGRELATLILLAAMAWLAAKSFNEWLAYFIFGFAVWDIFYYIWLALIIKWPSSLMDWDILFLIHQPILEILISSTVSGQ